MHYGTPAQELFADRKFGLFIHWGLYSIPGSGEWVQHNEQIPAAEYEALREQFRRGWPKAHSWTSAASKCNRQPGRCPVKR